MNGFIALYLIACLDPTNHNTCVSLPVTDSTQAQPDGSEMTMTGCMGIEGANSAKKFWEDHEDMHKAYHFGGWSCQIGNKKAADRSRAWSQEGSMYGYAYIKWKIAMARMQDANVAEAEITPDGKLTRPATREIAEHHLDRYFEMIEARLPELRLQGRSWFPCREHGHNAPHHGKHIQACSFDPGTSEWHAYRHAIAMSRYPGTLPAGLRTASRSMPSFLLLVAMDLLVVTFLLGWAVQWSS
jgi:hypothetical protein